MQIFLAAMLLGAAKYTANRLACLVIELRAEIESGK